MNFNIQKAIKRRKNDESVLQQACIRWFDAQYPEHKVYLFAIPNGGKRNIVEASRLKAEGVRAGVSDLFLAVPVGMDHGLFLEAKTKTGSLTENQRQFHIAVEEAGYSFVVFRDIDNFIKVVTNRMRSSGLLRKE